MATTYRNERREPVEGDANLVIKVLGLLDVEGGSQADRRSELSRLTESSQADVLASAVAVRVNGHRQPAM